MRQGILIWSFVTLVLILVILVVFRNYLSLDEPEILWEIRNGRGPGSYGSYPRFLSEGRPLYAFFALEGIRLAGTFANFKYLRVVGVLITFVFCFLIYRYLKKEGFSEHLSFLTAVLIFCLPSFSVFICWAESYPHQIPSILSFCAGILAFRGLEKHLGGPDPGSVRSNVYLVSAVCIQVIALFFYQTLALAFLMPAFFSLILRREVPVRNKLVFFSYFCFVFFLSLGIYYQVFQGLISRFEIVMTDRGKIGFDPVLKLKWLMKNFLEISKFHLLLYKLKPVQYLFTVVTAFILGRDVVKRRFMDLFFLFSFSVLLLLPMLMIQDNWMASRNFALVAGIWVFYLIHRIFELVRVPNVGLTVGISAVFAGLMLCNMELAWVRPQVQDYNSLREYVSKLPDIRDHDLTIEVCPPSWDLHEAGSPYKFYSDEFNSPVFLGLWPLEPALKELYSEKHPDISSHLIHDHIHILKLKTKGEFSPEKPRELIHLDLNYP